MYQSITQNDFIDTINRLRPDNFSYEGLCALFEYFEELEDSCDTRIEFDPIAICCEYSEMSVEELLSNYTDFTSVEEIEDYTQVIHVNDDLVIIADF
jgi:hypothetical protein